MNKETRNCENCPAVVYPYQYTRGRLLPKEDWIPTCRMNITPYYGNMPNDGRGMYGACDPEHCEGPNGRRYYGVYDNPEHTKGHIEYEN